MERASRGGSDKGLEDKELRGPRPVTGRPLTSASGAVFEMLCRLRLSRRGTSDWALRFLTRVRGWDRSSGGYRPAGVKRHTRAARLRSEEAARALIS